MRPATKSGRIKWLVSRGHFKQGSILRAFFYVSKISGRAPGLLDSYGKMKLLVHPDSAFSIPIRSLPLVATPAIHNLGAQLFAGRIRRSPAHAFACNQVLK